MRYPEATDGCTELAGVRGVEQLDCAEARLRNAANAAAVSILIVAVLNVAKDFRKPVRKKGGKPEPRPSLVVLATPCRRPMTKGID